jgi:hypothetical protein
MRVLRLGPELPPERRINLADLGFCYRVSEDALARIHAAQIRATLVITTAHRYRFR